MKYNVFLHIVRQSLAIAAVALVAATLAFAQRDSKEVRGAAERAREATTIFNEVMGDPDKAIPRNLLDTAEAIAIFPGVINAAFIVGGRGGEGLIVRRTSNGWGAPAFFKIGGGSLGAQIGGEKIDYIMLIQNDGGLQGLLEDKFEFGGEVNVAAGPVGRESSVATNTTLDAGILTYSRSKGLFAGIALKGAVISPDNTRNKAVYKLTAREILAGNNATVAAPDNVRVISNALTKFSPRRGTRGLAGGSETSAPATRPRTANASTTETTTSTTTTTPNN